MEPDDPGFFARHRKAFVRVGVLLALGVILQNIPGTYTFRDVSGDVDLDSPEGVALLGMERVTVSATLEFDRPTLQRVSRNAQLRVPAGATLELSAESRPRLDEENNEVVLTPENVRLISDKPLTFIYRNVPLALSRELATTPDGRLQARGRYRILSAIPHLHRYRRERGPRRVWQVPDRALVSADARFAPNHTFQFPGEIRLKTDSRGGTLRLRDLRYGERVWHEGTVEATLSFEDVFEVSDARLHRLRGGSLVVEGEFAGKGNGPSALDTSARLSWVSAQLSARENTLGAEFSNVDARMTGTLLIDNDHRIDSRDVSAQLTGRVERLLLANDRDRIAVPDLDLLDTPLRVYLDDDRDQIRVEVREPLDLRGLSWTRTRPRETLRVEDGRLRLSPFSFTFSKGEGGVARGASGLLEAWSVSLTRRDTQRVSLTQGVRLQLAAEELRLVNGDFLVSNGSVQGGSGALTAERNGLHAILRGAGLSVTGNKTGEDAFTFQGRVLAGDGADIKVDGPRGLPDLSVFASAHPVNFSGDQDHIRLGLPNLTLAIPKEDLKAMLDDFLEQNRERIRKESRESISVEVNLRGIRSLEFAEDSVEVVGEGRVSALGGLFDTSFSARMRVDFDLPVDVKIHESNLGVRVYLTGLSLNRVNPRIERLILDQFRQPLFRETRPLSKVVGDLPEGVYVKQSRLYPEEDTLVLEISGDAILE